MTNQLKPQQLLEIARVVEKIPNNYDWTITPKGRVIQTAKDEDGLHLLSDEVFEPHKPTERGQAQLMRVVFALWDKSSEMHLYGDKNNNVAVLGMDTYFNKQKGIGKTKAEAIINLAAEVL